MTSNPWSRWIGCTAVVMTAVAGSARAAVPSSLAEPALVTVGRAPRVHRNVAWQRDAAGLAGWTAIYDHDTGVPVRWWGQGQLARGAMTDPAIAAAWARAFLAAHLDVLAPGAAASDFVIVANQLDAAGELRSVGFAQYAGGVPVRGGAISFAFKRDHLIMVGSTALPNITAGVTLAAPARRLAAARVSASAVAWLAGTGRKVAARGAGQQLIVPIINPRDPVTGALDITYHLAEQISVVTTSGDPGAWDVFVDAATGLAFARASTLSYASGRVLFDVSDRAPMAAAGRHAQPAGDAIHNVNGADVTAGLDGVVSWTGEDPAHVAPGLAGPRVQVVNQAGALTTGNLMLPADGTCTWSHPTDELVDAQIDAFIYANQAKQFALGHFDPALAFLADKITVFVNEPGTCNAYNGIDGVHFFIQTAGRCENTGRMADVVYHEVGHALHHHAIIPGVGQFNSSMSEGVADTLAVAMTGDPAVGRGFYFDDRPLRDLAPATKKIWPRDATGEVHAEGEIYGEAMWDLRVALEASLGRDAGYARFLKIYYGTMQRAVDIPSCFAEALVSDDDDGDLGNGTPDDCAIISAFTAHGLFDPTVTGGVLPPTRDGYDIAITGAAPAGASCHAPSVASATMMWRTRGGTPAETVVPLVADGSALRATIPAQADGTIVEYRVEATLSNGVVQAFPSNLADPRYQFSIGAPTTIWCSDFEHGADGWTHKTMPESADRWEVGAPRGVGGDPGAAHSGSQVLGLALAGTGRYPSVMTTLAQSPGIDLQGFVNVHLQYWRWLGVEDGWSDQATILANDAQVWSNFTSLTNPSTAEVNHIDQEWRFQDLDLHDLTHGNNIKLTFTLTSDVAFEAGGWNLDDVCLVGWAPVCGNEILEAGEQCDDPNHASGDGCSSTCQFEHPAMPPAHGGGCSAGGGAGSAGGLLALAALRRRRQRLPSLR